MTESLNDVVTERGRTRIKIGFATMKADERIVGGLQFLMFEAPDFVALSVDPWTGTAPARSDRTPEALAGLLAEVRAALALPRGINIMYGAERHPMDLRLGTLRHEGGTYRVEGAHEPFHSSDGASSDDRAAAAAKLVLLQQVTRMATRAFPSWAARAEQVAAEDVDSE